MARGGPTVKRGMDCGMESFRGIIKRVWLPVEAIIMGVASYMHVSQQNTDVSSEVLHLLGSSGMHNASIYKRQGML